MIGENEILNQGGESMEMMLLAWIDASVQTIEARGDQRSRFNTIDNNIEEAKALHNKKFGSRWGTIKGICF